MRYLLIALLALCLPLPSAQAFDNNDSPEQYDNQGEVYQDDTYSDESYQEESAPEETYQGESSQDNTSTAEPAYLDPEVAAHQKEVRALCQEYANDMPPEDQSSYIEQCMQSQGY